MNEGFVPFSASRCRAQGQVLGGGAVDEAMLGCILGEDAPSRPNGVDNCFFIRLLPVVDENFARLDVVQDVWRLT